MKKRLIALVLSVVLVFSLVACTAKDTDTPSGTENNGQEATTHRVAYVADVGFDEYQWLTLAKETLEDWANGRPDVEIKFVEAADPNTYEPMIRSLCEEGYEVIITNFAGHADATKKLAKEYPDINFAILDGGFSESEMGEYSNFMQFGIERGYNAFVSGFVAASMSETGKVGFIGGADNAALSWILAGWQQGVEYAGLDTTDYVAWTNDWTDPNVGIETAKSLIDKGCDVIIASAGGTEFGVVQACADNDVYYCAMDGHYYDYVRGLELGCAASDIGLMASLVYEAAFDGTFPAGQVKYYGVDTGAVWYEFSEDTPVPADIQEQANAIADKVNSGEIVIDKEPLHK